jgi:hypothetical protein
VVRPEGPSDFGHTDFDPSTAEMAQFQAVEGARM